MTTTSIPPIHLQTIYFDVVNLCRLITTVCSVESQAYLDLVVHEAVIVSITLLLTVHYFTPGAEIELEATGALYKVDPDRVVTKRIVLSGHPLRIHKRGAVIRYMFFNRGERFVEVQGSNFRITSFS